MGVKVRVAVRRRGGLGVHPARLARNSETRVTNSHTWSGSGVGLGSGLGLGLGLGLGWGLGWV